MLIINELDSNGILTLTLNRPDKLNALSTEVLTTLSTLLAEAKANDSVKAVLVTGTGKAFCAGADISKLAECNATSGYEFALLGQNVFHQFETLGKPSLAAVNGYAFGGGCELLISTSMRIASTKAQFGQPEIKLGVIPGYGGTQRLSRLIGKGRAMDLCLTGRFIDANTALSWGLVSEVVEEDALIPRAKEMLTQITQLAPIALQSIMDVINQGFDMNLQEALHLEAVHFAKVCATTDKQEGVSAFLEKRQAKFIGA